jgi:hypothetical protein
MRYQAALLPEPGNALGLRSASRKREGGARPTETKQEAQRKLCLAHVQDISPVRRLPHAFLKLFS